MAPWCVSVGNSGQPGGGVGIHMVLDIVEYGCEIGYRKWILMYALYSTLNSNTDVDIHIDV